MTLPEDVAVQPAERGGLFEDLTDIFLHPRRLFERSRNGSFVRPTLIAMVLGGVIMIASLSLVIPFFEAEAARAVRQSGQEIPAAAAGAVATMMKVTTVLGSLLGPWFVAFVGGLVLLAAGRLVGARLSFRQSALVAAWSYIPVAVLGTLALAIQGALVNTDNLRGITDGQIGPGRFLDPESLSPVALALVQRLDLFGLWGLVLTAIGVAVIARKDMTTGALAAIVNFAILSLFTVVPALLR